MNPSFHMNFLWFALSYMAIKHSTVFDDTEVGGFEVKPHQTAKGITTKHNLVMVRSKKVVNIPGMGDHPIIVYRLHSYPNYWFI